jgi:hypothetical protein
MARPSTTTTTEPVECADCADCAEGLDHCHESSIEHADGYTECLDPTCTFDHGLHTWQLPCSVFDPPCACSPDEADLHPASTATFELAA